VFSRFINFLSPSCPFSFLSFCIFSLVFYSFGASVIFASHLSIVHELTDPKACNRSIRWPSFSLSNKLCHCLSPLDRVKLKVKVKVKFPSVFLTEHHAINAYLGSGGIAPHILDLGTRWRWVVSFTPWPLYPQGESP
jgi:hypothetical protein